MFATVKAPLVKAVTDSHYSAAAVWSVGFTRVKDYSLLSSLSAHHADRNGLLSEET